MHTERSQIWRQLLAPVYRSRRWLVFGGSLAGQAALVGELRALGAERAFVVANERGVGPVPADEDAESFLLEMRARDVVDGIRRFERAMGALPDAARAAIERWDPDRSARAIARIVLDDVPEVAGRRRWAVRPASWRALEDKVAIDAFWDAAGLPRPPSHIVAARLESLRDAAARLDRGEGTVWSGDARDGLHGGAVYQRWVRNGAQAEEAARFLVASCTRARVAPFLEGIPCSVHGIVLDDAVAVFRPVEMVTLRRADASSFVYGGFGTVWDPPAQDREAIRAFGRRTGEALRERVGYRGAFTVDGVLCVDGFLPTELNPRVGGALRLLEESAGVPLALLSFAVQERVPADWRPAELEEHVLAAADARRAGLGFGFVEERYPESEHPLVRDGAGWRRAHDDEERDATLAIARNDTGAFVRFALAPAGIRAGRSIAPDVVAALAYCDRAVGTRFGALEPARAVR